MAGEAGQFAWRRLGDGPALIMINGYAATGLDWDPVFLGALAERWTVICPDNRGMGASSLGEEPLTMAAMAGDVARLMDRLQLDSAPVVGWSMGGFVAQELGAAFPDRVSALVLLSTDPGGPEAVRADEAVWAQLTDRSGSPREQAARLLDLLFPAPVAAGLGTAVIDVVAEARSRLSAAALDQQWDAIQRWYSNGVVERPGSLGELPVLAAAGALDVVIPAPNAEALARRSDSWLARFAGCGHALMAQQPHRLVDLIDAFLDPS